MLRACCCIPTGKTRGAEKLITDIVLQEGRVLIVSNRVTLAHDHISNFNRLVKAAWTERHGAAVKCPDSLLFVQYNKTMEGTNLAEVPRLACQAESLWRLKGAEKYNLVLMDESESILMQLSSEATMSDRAGLVSGGLYDVLLKGEKVVFADAYMTNRTLNLVHLIFNAREEKVKVIYNSWCQEPPKACRLDDKKQFKEELIKRLKSGTNCVAFCGTKTFADEVYKQVKKELSDLAILSLSLLQTAPDLGSRAHQGGLLTDRKSVTLKRKGWGQSYAHKSNGLAGFCRSNTLSVGRPSLGEASPMADKLAKVAFAVLCACFYDVCTGEPECCIA